MKNLNLFQYLAAFVTIVLAIAISDMLVSLHRLIVARRRVRWGALPLAAAIYVFLMVLSEFFSLWVNADVRIVSFAYLVLLTVVSGLAALAAFTVLPDTVPDEGLDLYAYYQSIRSYLFVTLSLALIGDLGRTLYLAYAESGRLLAWSDAFWWYNVPLTLAIVALYSVLAWAGHRYVQIGALTLSFALALNNLHGWQAG